MGCGCSTNQPNEPLNRSNKINMAHNSYSVEQYQKSFDGRAYAGFYLSNDDTAFDLKSFPEEFIHRMCVIGKIHGDTLLDVGSGPTVRSAISTSACIPNIYLSDLVESNRKEVQKWLNKEPDAIEYSWEFNHMAKLEGVSDPSVLEERVRQAVKDVLPCNVLLPNPLDPIVEQYDVVTSSLCLDCFSDQKDYFQGLKNIASLMKPGGRLVLVGMLSCPEYKVGEVDLPSTNVDGETVKRAISQAGLSIVDFEERYYESPADHPEPEYEGGEFGALCKLKK